VSERGSRPKSKEALADARRLLGTCALFAGLSADERAGLAARARIRTFDAHETIFTINSPGAQLMAVLRGTVRIRVPSSTGRALVLANIQPGEIFGELSVLDGKERPMPSRRRRAR
jgi:CRP/FNR family cyclic AMP-dependent transcriptional regulator